MSDGVARAYVPQNHSLQSQTHGALPLYDPPRTGSKTNPPRPDFNHGVTIGNVCKYFTPRDASDCREGRLLRFEILSRNFALGLLDPDQKTAYLDLRDEILHALRLYHMRHAPAEKP